jgi:hypothetical protein
MIDQPVAWPFVIAGGLALGLAGFEILSAAVSTNLFAGLIVTALVIFTMRQGAGMIADVKNHVAISGLAFGRS